MSNKAKFTMGSDNGKVDFTVDLDNNVDIELSLLGEKISSMMYDFDFPQHCNSLTVGLDEFKRKLEINFFHTGNIYTLSIDGSCIRICKNNRDKCNDYIRIKDWRNPDKIRLDKE